MCGIIGVTGSKHPYEVMLRGLSALEYRGYDSAGIATVDIGSKTLFRARSARRAASIEELSSKLENAPSDVAATIGHTRWATHGAPTEQNAHPHLDCTARIALIHNGIIENHRELAARLLAEGHVFSSETDTEVLAHLLEREVASGKRLHEALCACVPLLRGDFAVAAICADEPEVIVAARRTSPLIIGVGDKESYLGSDISALLPFTRTLYQLSDDEVAELRPGKVSASTPDGRPITLSQLEVTWDLADAQRGGFDDFMSKEMDEQPKAIADTLLGRVVDDHRFDIEELAIDPVELAELGRVYYVACGSSYHASLLGRLATEQLAKLPAEADIASEFRYRDSVLGEDCLCVFVSQSGETIDTLHAMREAKRRGAKVLALTNVVDSLMAREADGVLYTRAGPEIGVASTKCHLAQLAMLDVFALYLAQARAVLGSSEAAAYAKTLLELPELLSATVEMGESYREVARQFAKVEDFYFLGRKTGYPIALEGALKLKELAYVRAEAYAAGEMKHGPISLIEPGAVVLVVATRTELFDKVMANVEEMRARGATIVGLIEKGDDEAASRLDAILEVPAVPELCAPIVDVVPLQFFAHEIARNRGNNVDRPRNLAKVVTVE